MVSNTDNEQFSVAMRTNTSIGFIHILDETIQDISQTEQQSSECAYLTNQSIIRSAVDFIPTYYSINNNPVLSFNDGKKRNHALPQLNFQ